MVMGKTLRRYQRSSRKVPARTSFHRFRFVAVDLAGTPPTVTINACLDYSALKLVYKSNQSPVPGTEITTPRVSVVVKVSRYTTGQWLVNESKEGGSSC